MLKKKRFLIGGLIVILALGYLGFSGFRSSAAYYYTVSEIKQQGSAVYGKTLRVSGTVVPDSVYTETATLTLGFTIVEGENRLQVVYRGVTPDTFRADSDVVVQGQLDSQGVFQANQLLTQCASKYEPQQ